MLSVDDLRVIDYRPHAAMRLHDHDEASFSVIIDGGFVERIAGGARDYKRGCVTFCPAGVKHAQEFGDAGARQIILRPQAAWLAYLTDSHVALDDAPYANSALLRQLGLKLFTEMNRADEFAAIAREGIVLEIVAAFGRAGQATPPENIAPLWLRHARDYMRAHAYTTPTLKHIARAAGRHEIHLAREFRRHYGTSIGTALRQIKTERAAELLAHSRTDITEIALRCGFASHSHLCNVFKAHYGVTPSHYRARR